MSTDWLTGSWTGALIAVISALGAYALIVLYTRLVGLRSFSKLSSFDFAVTVAIGSMLATTVLSRDVSLPYGAAGVGALYLVQYLTARLRTRSSGFASLVDNQPVLLMRDGRMREDAMRRVGVTRADLLAKLREANVLQMESARAVIFESTGDISVLHSGDDLESRLDMVLLEGVEGV